MPAPEIPPVQHALFRNYRKIDLLFQSFCTKLLRPRCHGERTGPSIRSLLLVVYCYPEMSTRPSPESSSFSLSPVPLDATRWTLVTAAAGASPGQAIKALEELCQLYWRPLWRFVKVRFTLSDADAEDVVQDFICTMLKQNTLARADAARGRFRSFLFKSVEHHFLHILEKRKAQRRGGAASHVSATLADDYNRISDPAFSSEEAATAAADREWALVTMRSALDRVASHYLQRGQNEKFLLLKQLVMSPEMDAVRYAGAAETLRMTPAGIAVEIHRFRKRLRDAFSREIRETVSNEEEEQAECRYLLKLLA